MKTENRQFGYCQDKPRVRGESGKILSKEELAKELSNFIHSELEDIDERLPFYEDFIQDGTAPLIFPESRARSQLCFVGVFFLNEGGLSTLRNL